MITPYHPPVKRSVEIAGHKTSVSLEPLFWDMLRAAAATEGVPVNALVARIDEERIASDTPCGLAAAIRLWLVSEAMLRLALVPLARVPAERARLRCCRRPQRRGQPVTRRPRPAPPAAAATANGAAPAESSRR